MNNQSITPRVLSQITNFSFSKISSRMAIYESDTDDQIITLRREIDENISDFADHRPPMDPDNQK